jgi:CrcB protein
MLKAFTLVGLGGAIGSIGRYLAAQYIQSRFVSSEFPYGTLIVNITGCFLIGVIFGLTAKADILAEWRLFLVTGICGGYTTFSAFSYESITLLKSGNFVHFAMYIAASVILGLLATLVPVWLLQKV